MSQESNREICPKCKGQLWPIGINPTMDSDAIKVGLGHWSCVSVRSNSWWVRRDGIEWTFDYPQNNWHRELARIDKLAPMLSNYPDNGYHDAICKGSRSENESPVTDPAKLG